jgi:hypothetical protein
MQSPHFAPLIMRSNILCFENRYRSLSDKRIPFTMFDELPERPRGDIRTGVA